MRNRPGMTEERVVRRRENALQGERNRTDTACDVCGGPTYESRCKIICTRCGFTRDCSDP
jgi:uncharacterized Zn finger protein (UPF0148 family)